MDNDQREQNKKNKQIILSEIARIHREWSQEIEPNVEMNPEDSNPHTEGGESDYNLHYPTVSATPEQEADFQRRVAGLYAELKAITESGGVREPETEPGKEYSLAVNGELVQMLVLHDFDSGWLSYRENGQWVQVKPDDDMPVLEDADLIEVGVGAVEIWDEISGGEVLKGQFATELLDHQE